MNETCSVADRPMFRFLTASIAREIGILLALSVLFPFLIHILPMAENERLGARLLPMFYAPLLAVLWGRPASAWTLALTAPWLNWILTSHPMPRGATLLTLELVGFVFISRFLLTRSLARSFLAAPAYLSGKALALAVATLFPYLVGGRLALDWAAQSVALGTPGIAILLLLNWLALRCYPPGGPGGAAAA